MIRFEWDPVKARANERKHRVSFEDAAQVFDDPFAVFEKDFIDEAGEQRWHALGLVGGVAVLLVVHAIREEGEIIRIVSARRATRIERKRYEQIRDQDVG